MQSYITLLGRLATAALRTGIQIEVLWNPADCLATTAQRTGIQIGVDPKSLADTLTMLGSSGRKKARTRRALDTKEGLSPSGLVLDRCQVNSHCGQR